MKIRILLVLSTLLVFLFGANVFPVEAARNSYGSAYRTSTYRNYSNGGSLRIQDGYFRENGTYVQPHLKTTPDNTIYNNRKYQLGY